MSHSSKLIKNYNQVQTSSFNLIKNSSATQPDNENFSILDWKNTGLSVAYDAGDISSSGQIIIGVTGGSSHVSEDFGENFAQRDFSDISGTPADISISADGSLMVMVIEGIDTGGEGYIYRSTDKGISWSNTITINGTLQTSVFNRFWKTVSISTDGMIQVAATATGFDEQLNDYPPQIYVSTDYGLNWTSNIIINGTPQNTFSSSDYIKSSISADGSIQSIITSDTIYQSTDSGNTWTTTNLGGNLDDIDVSASGKYQTVVGYLNLIRRSDDFGSTFSTSGILINGVAQSTKTWKTVSVSGNGRYQTAAEYFDGSVFVSDDYGITWTDATSAGTRDWKDSAISFDGSYQVVFPFLSTAVILDPQTNDKNSPVEINSVIGSIVPNWPIEISSRNFFTFTVNNSYVKENSIIILKNTFSIFNSSVSNITNGSFDITVSNPNTSSFVITTGKIFFIII